MTKEQQIEYLKEHNVTFVTVTDTSVTVVPKSNELYYIPMENPIFEEVKDLVLNNVHMEHEEQDMLVHYGEDGFWYKIEDDTSWDDNIQNFFVKHEIYEKIKKMK